MRSPTERPKKKSLGSACYSRARRDRRRSQWDKLQLKASSRVERERILRIYAKGDAVGEYNLGRILSHWSKFIQMESITQRCSVWNNIGEDKDPDIKWRLPFENFGKYYTIELRKIYELCLKNDDQIMQKNDLSVFSFSFNLNWRETPDEFVASDVVPSGKHLSHKLRTGANAYEDDHSEFPMWPQCKKAFGLSISMLYCVQCNEASWQVGSGNFTKLAEEYRTPTAEEAA